MPAAEQKKSALSIVRTCPSGGRFVIPGAGCSGEKGDQRFAWFLRVAERGVDARRKDALATEAKRDQRQSVSIKRAESGELAIRESEIWHGEFRVD
jgi:hypothetical protein